LINEEGFTYEIKTLFLNKDGNNKLVANDMIPLTKSMKEYGL
jgi:hypothetical protein